MWRTKVPPPNYLVGGGLESENCKLTTGKSIKSPRQQKVSQNFHNTVFSGSRNTTDVALNVKEPRILRVSWAVNVNIALSMSFTGLMGSVAHRRCLVTPEIPTHRDIELISIARLSLPLGQSCLTSRGRSGEMQIRFCHNFKYFSRFLLRGQWEEEGRWRPTRGTES